MITYIIRRIFQTALMALLGALTIYTVLVYLMPRAPYGRYQQLQAQAKVQTGLQVRVPVPNDPFRTRLEAGPLLKLKELESAYGLDRPWPLSFLAWLYDPQDTTGISHDTFEEVPKGLDIWIGGLHITGDGALLGEWGISEYVSEGQPASTLVRNRSGNTLLLVGVAVLFTLIVGVIIGVLGAVRQNTKLDHALTLLSFAGLSMPPFVLGLLLIFALAVIPFILHNRAGMTWLPLRDYTRTDRVVYRSPGSALQVEFTGFVSSDDLPRYYQSCDVYCAPSTGGESFGIVLLEAMAAGTPVLASRIPGYANVLTHGREGFLAEPKSPASIAAGLVRLLSDRELRAWIKEAGQRTARQYDWPVIASRIVSYYERTILSHQQAATAPTTPRRRRRRTLQEIIGS